jgi:hypothetical protein
LAVPPVRRWLPLAVAALATALLATGSGVAANQLAAPRSQPAPQLRTVSAATLAGLGLTLSAAAAPPYCGLASAAASHGWLRPGAVACPISRGRAESAARQDGRSNVVESVLALVTSRSTPAIGRDHLTWLVVTQRTTGICQSTTQGWPVCLGLRGLAWNQLVLVDAYTAGVVHTLRLSVWARGVIGRPYPPVGSFGGA